MNKKCLDTPLSPADRKRETFFLKNTQVHQKRCVLGAKGAENVFFFFSSRFSLLPFILRYARMCVDNDLKCDDF